MGKSDLPKHITWTWAYPTPRGGLVNLVCLCGFTSVPMTERHAGMYAWIHESGIQGLPGTMVEAASD